MFRSESLSGEQIVARLAPPDDAELLMALGRVQANPARRHIGFLALSGAPKVLLRAVVPLAEVEAVGEQAARIHPLRLGRWDDWRIAWIDDAQGFSIWLPDEGKIWELVDGELVGRHDVLVGIASVEAYTSDDWVEQGVRVRCEGRQGSHVIWSRQNQSVVYDLGYDGLSLDWDMSGARQLAMGLAARFDVPCHNSY